ncbi:glycosyltransferase family 4 protein [Sulfitobacter donghicola]|uniref:Glycosyl transferase family 1 n=1 Tax=Sulfitobacter donghicola DSW-25 = KCTC 12864 = JCM 14565 TaxID=1300350 RepID=A0A073IZ94_9RHOB|nr:glycosyltransferase family 4 protein [Sulfitobacter donghicola]KEJ90737.1 glycosyl transferase family 1 [Sulfitobacter donghicola DSW-25 = KCTC 12864 = JCM 14565]KIN67993.1 Glycosyl transferase, group 1 [Sulfitobacter donghicola DSW-25 = KCTC 12864 = JCM 14565]
MNILFVHQNMPGQYRELVQWLAERGEHKIYFLTQRKNAAKIEGVETRVYRPHRTPTKDSYGLSKVWEEASGAGFGAVLAAQRIEREDGFKPDLIVGHVGWGELTFFKQIWPDVPIIGFFEYYYRLHGGPVNFDKEEPVNEHTPFLLQARNVVPALNLTTVDRALSPTKWQRDCFPPEMHSKIYVCHDGIRTDKLKPDPNAELKLGRIEKPITCDDEIVTYMARNLERMRGFHQFMRALPDILEARPNARVLIIGGNDVSYGAKSKKPGGLRGEMEAEVGDRVDWSRVHFLGQVPYEHYQKIIQVSSCHIYMTMPFVMSWSLLETMSMQATIVASDVEPVREAVTHGETGMLVDFHDPAALAKQVIDVLARPEDFAHLGPAARKHVVAEYDFLTKCLPEHLAEMNALLPEDKQISSS